MVSTQRFGKAEVTFDDRYLPLMISRWEGPATVEAVAWHAALQDEAAAELVRQGKSYIVVADASFAMRPEPEVRKLFAHNLSQAKPELRDATIATFTVMTNPVMRGVITAVGWLSKEARAIKTVATMPEALAQALELLDERGIPRPAGLSPDSYERPRASEVA